MKLLAYSLCVLSVALPATSSGDSSCIDPAEIRQTDRRYEESLVQGDHAFLDGLLADEFIWVHNHAGSTDSKESLLQRIKTSRHGSSSKSRNSTDVVVRRKGNAAVVSGFTTVVRPDEYVERTGGLKSAKYHFMRTYVLVDGKCVLLANHTMLVPDDE
jgi:hypothetical protein